MEAMMGTVNPNHTSVPENSVRQICFLVDDLDMAMEEWTRIRGAGPFFQMRHVPLGGVTYRGRPSTYDHSAALGQWGVIQIELHQKHCSTPSITEEAFPNGATGVHHMTYGVDDVDAEIARMEALGFPTVFTCSKGTQMYTAWFDTRKLQGCLTEVYRKSPFIEESYRRIRDAARDWSGEYPVRSLATLSSEIIRSIVAPKGENDQMPEWAAE
jgi:hypothetical protein